MNNRLLTIRPKSEVKTPERACRACGDMFTGVPSKVFCGTICKRQYYKAVKELKEMKTAQ